MSVSPRWRRLHRDRHRPDLAGPWTGSPDPDLGDHLRRLDVLLAERSRRPVHPLLL